MHDEQNRLFPEAMTIEVDLTSLCVKRAVLRLPYRAQDLFETATTLTLQHPESGKTFELLYTPPRDLSQLEAFFTITDAKANDKLILKIQGQEGLVLLHKRPITRRPIKEAPQETKAPPKRQVEAIETPYAQPKPQAAEQTQLTSKVTVKHVNPRPTPQMSDPERSQPYPAKQPQPLPQAPINKSTKPESRQPRTNNDVLAFILDYVNQPNTPVILRSDELAEELNLSQGIIQAALEHLSKLEDANLRPIKTGVFQIVKRGTTIR